MLSCNARPVLSCVAAGHINVKGMHVHVLVDVHQKLAASVDTAVPERRHPASAVCWQVLQLYYPPQHPPITELARDELKLAGMLLFLNWATF